MTIQSYVYPQDLLSNKERIARSLTFMPITAIERNAIINNESHDSGTVQCLIVLPTPTGLNDSVSHNWSASTIFDAVGGLGSALSSTTRSLKVIKGVNLDGAVGNFVNAVGDGAERINNSPAYGYLSTAFGFRKKMINPGYFQNYTGSSLRSFMFDYIFQPRSREEALTVIDIITAFKKYASPNITKEFLDKSDTTDNDSSAIISMISENTQTLRENVRNFLGSSDTKFWMKQPCYWKIIFGNKYLNDLVKMRNVVITNLTVDYGDNVETFKDGIPKVFKLNINVSEVDIVDENQYKMTNTDDKNSNIASSDFSYFGKDSEIETENKTIGTSISSLATKKLP